MAHQMRAVSRNGKRRADRASSRAGRLGVASRPEHFVRFASTPRAVSDLELRTARVERVPRGAAVQRSADASRMPRKTGSRSTPSSVQPTIARSPHSVALVHRLDRIDCPAPGSSRLDHGEPPSSSSSAGLDTAADLPPERLGAAQLASRSARVCAHHGLLQPPPQLVARSHLIFTQSPCAAACRYALGALGHDPFESLASAEIVQTDRGLEVIERPHQPRPRTSDASSALRSKSGARSSDALELEQVEGM